MLPYLRKGLPRSLGSADAQGGLLLLCLRKEVAAGGGAPALLVSVKAGGGGGEVFVRDQPCGLREKRDGWVCLGFCEIVPGGGTEVPQQQKSESGSWILRG